MINWYQLGKTDYYSPNGADARPPIPPSSDLKNQWWQWYLGWVSEHLMGYYCDMCGKAAIDCNRQYDCTK